MAELNRGAYWKKKFLNLLERIGLRILFVIGLVGFELFVTFACFYPIVMFWWNFSGIFLDVVRVVLVLTYFSIHLLFLYLAVRPPRRLREWWIRREADRWLSDRNSTGYRPSRIVRRIVRQTIWVPTILVMIAYLFFPEFAGVWSQRNKKEFSISGHTLNIPRTWIVQWYGRVSDGDYLSGYIVRGVFYSKFPRFWDTVPDGGSFVFRRSREAGKERSDRINADATRTVMNQGLKIDCQEWRPDLNFRWIHCESPKGEIEAIFRGRPEAAESFYAAMSSPPSSQ